MKNKLSIALSLLTTIVVGTLVFLFSKTIDYPTLFHALKLIIPSAAIAYAGGCAITKIITKSKTSTTIISTDTQQQYIDDLLMTPDEVFNITSPYDEQTVKQKNDNNDTEAN